MNRSVWSSPYEEPPEPPSAPYPAREPGPPAREPAPAREQATSREPAIASEAGEATLREALADLAAAEARVERDAERVLEETRAKVVRDLLPVVDNFDRTLRAASRAAG